MTIPIESVQPVLAVKDVAAAIAFYDRLGFVLCFHRTAHPQYAGVRRDGVEIHLQWHAAEEWDLPGDRPVLRLATPDPDGLQAEFRAAGISASIKPVFDSSWGTREFHLRDADGHVLMFHRNRWQALRNARLPGAAAAACAACRPAATLR